MTRVLLFSNFTPPVLVHGNALFRVFPVAFVVRLRHSNPMNTSLNLDQLSEQQLRTLAAQLLAEVQKKDSTILSISTKNQKLKHEMAILKRHKFGRTSEAFNSPQRSLLDDLINEDITAIEDQLAHHDQQLTKPNPSAEEKRYPKRTALPPELPRTIIRHEPEQTLCACGCQLKRMGEDVSEKLDYTPGVFTVERHVRGKWVCDHCETLTQAPVPAQVIDKGIPTAGLLAQILVAKYEDHLSLYR